MEILGVHLVLFHATYAEELEGCQPVITKRKRSDPMDEKKVIAFLRCSASAPLNLALEMANLTDKERTAVDLCGIRGLTYDEAAEALQEKSKDKRREVDTIKRWYKSAKTKLCRAWSGLYWIDAIVEYEMNSQK